MIAKLIRYVIIIFGCTGIFYIALTHVSPVSVHPIPKNKVRLIDWNRFHPSKGNPDHLALSAKILLNSARWGNRWIDNQFRLSAQKDYYKIPNINYEPIIRPPSSVALGLATVLKTGLHSKEKLGVSERELTTKVTKLIKGIVRTHKANGGAWGDHWQSSLWAALVGRAGWMLWTDLDDDCRVYILRMIIFEADRHLGKDYEVPYWNGVGGDSKSEENSWEALILQLAITMLPDHKHVQQWKKICSELQISAYSRPKDRELLQPLFDGKSPKEWLSGFNMHDDGIVINHGFIHNDYMVCISILQMQGFLTFSLAELEIPQTTDFNFDIIYKALIEKKFTSPPYQSPGGTMYIPGSPDVYYPQGTDWSLYRYDIFYNMDAYASILTGEKKYKDMAREWFILRGQRILQMQSRHEDGHIFASGEFDRYSGSEALGLWMLADAYLIQWLDHYDAISDQGNWLFEMADEQ